MYCLSWFQMVDGPSPEPDPNTGGSRFSRWFFPVGSQGNSKSNSRKSSINEEFGFLTGDDTVILI